MLCIGLPVRLLLCRDLLRVAVSTQVQASAPKAYHHDLFNLDGTVVAGHIEPNVFFEELFVVSVFSGPQSFLVDRVQSVLTG